MLLATISTPVAAPVIAATRLRKGSAKSARAAARLVDDALATAKAAGPTRARGPWSFLRADSAYYGARFSVTARMTPTVRAAIAGIPLDAWTAIHDPNAFVRSRHR